MFLFPLLLLLISIFSPLISWQGYSHPHSLECSPTIPTLVSIRNQFMAAQYFMIVHSFLFCTHSPSSYYAQQYIPCGPDCNACLTPPTRTRCPPALCTALLDTDRVTGSVSAAAAALSPSAYLSITPHSLYLSLSSHAWTAPVPVQCRQGQHNQHSTIYKSPALAPTH